MADYALEDLQNELTRRETEPWVLPRADQVHPELRSRFEDMAQDFYQQTGVPLRVTDTFRTNTEQINLYRRKPKLAARPGRSRHEYGDALDIDQSQVPTLEKLGLIDKYGFTRPAISKGETWHLELPRFEDASKIAAGKDFSLEELQAELSRREEQSQDFSIEDLQGELKRRGIDPATSKTRKQLEDEFQPVPLGSRAPTDATSETIAQFAAPAGEMIGEAMDLPMKPVRMALEKFYDAVIEPQRERTQKEFVETPEEAKRGAPEAFAGLPDKEVFVETMTQAMVPVVYGQLGRGLAGLGKLAKSGAYKYGPDFLFKPTAQGGLPAIAQEFTEGVMARINPETRARLMAERIMPEKPVEAAAPSPEEIIKPPLKPTPEAPPAPQAEAVPVEGTTPQIVPERGIGAKIEAPIKDISTQEQPPLPLTKGVTEPSAEKASPSEINYSSGGDAVGKEYHGYIAAVEPKTKKVIGQIKYAYYDGETAVKMVEVSPEYQRQGIATKLLEKLQSESETPIIPFGNFATETGNEVWRKFIASRDKPAEGQSALPPAVLQARDALAKEKGVAPAELEYAGEQEGVGGRSFHLFNIMDPEHPQFKSTVSAPIKGEKTEYPPIIQQALADWNSGKSYVDGNGNYHVKREGKPSGPIAPWNKEVKKAFADTGEFHKAAKALKSTIPKSSLLADETGAVSLGLLTPGLESAHNIKQGIQSLILPTAKSPEHLKAGEVLGSKLGTMHRNAEIAAKALKADSKIFDKMGVHNPDIPLTENPGIKFMSDMSQGRPMNPEAQQVADRVKKLFDNRLDQLEKAEVPIENVRENYFPGMWTKDSHRSFNQAMEEAFEGGRGRGAAEGGETSERQNVNDWSVADKAWVRNRTQELKSEGKGSDKSALSYLTRKPFKGKESFRKGKVFDDIMTGAEFGLDPISNNPLDLVKLKLAEMDRSIMANRAIQEWKKTGDVKFNPVTVATPEGWVRINDKYGTVWGPPIEGEYGRRIMGYYVAKEPVAEIMNNYLSSSLYNSPYFGTAYRGVMAVGNSLNQFQLGVFSSFHAGFTSLETQITAGAEVLKDIYGVVRGNRSVGDLGKTAAKYPVAMVRTAAQGAKVLAEWNNPQMDVPTAIPVGQLPTTKEARIAQVAKAAELAGAGFQMERGLRTYQAEVMMRDWYGGNKVRAALRSPIALTEAGMKPIMEFLVPRQKAGVFAEMVGRIMDQNPGKTLEELRPQIRQAWNRVDARLGQVRYDRLFINNSAKNVIQGLIRAPGWTGGTIAEVGGAPKDAAKFVKEWAETGKAPADIPDRVAYVISLLGTMAVANGLMTYAFTGERPQGMDWWAFRDGGTDDKGNPTRFLLPSYAKDIFAWYEKRAHTLVAKMHPLASIVGEIARNRDYYNNMIYDDEKGLWNKNSALRVGTHVLKAYIPFWIRGASEVAKREGGLKETLTKHPGKLIAPQFGVMPATRAYTQTAADALMDKYSSRFQIARTPDQAKIGDKKRELFDLLKQGQKTEANIMAREGVKEGWLTSRESQNLRKKAADPKEYRFQQLKDVGQAIKVYEVGTPEEKFIYGKLLIHKMSNDPHKTPEKFIQYKELRQKILTERKNYQGQLKANRGR